MWSCDFDYARIARARMFGQSKLRYLSFSGGLMSRTVRLGLVLPLTLFLGGAPAQVEFRKESPVANQVEVRFVDGSVVRMELLQETIDVVTKYGRLTVPTRDLRHVEFGLRLSEATRKS